MTPPSSRAPLQLWGGLECTVNRVGDRSFDQSVRGGHHDRPGDIRRIAELGVRVVRYPLLWERACGRVGSPPNFEWTDDRLTQLERHGVEPIATLLHHGSGPRGTDLLDPAFPDLFADYALAVARRYPHVRRYTPVNEPLTTARFSGLYGVWYPHHADDRSFARALVNQCRATLLAMAAIRSVQPLAELVPTEDLGKTHAPPDLQYQADFENERRWASTDLLCGGLTPGGPMWRYLREHGVGEGELAWFARQPERPHILGFNCYVTSERYLDPGLPGPGNGREGYADREAVRACPGRREGLGSLLREAWARYGRPLAVTEAHIGCTREEQVRWLAETWDAARTLHADGIDVRAVTTWALFGSLDWNSLVTRADGRYESGAYDASGDTPRLTAVGRVAQQLAAGAEPEHPCLGVPGWWHASLSPPMREFVGVRPLLIAGATGTLGRAFAEVCGSRRVPYRILTRQQMDIADAVAVGRALAEFHPWAVVNAAGFARVDEAERAPATCFRENVDGPATLAKLCASAGARMATFSSDLVFDGLRRSPYREDAKPAPLGVYGRSKVAGEEAVLGHDPTALVVRTAAFFGPWDPHNFAAVVRERVGRGERFLAADDLIVSPTYLPDLCHATLDLLADGETGIWHLTNAGAVTWYEFARRAIVGAGLPEHLVEPAPADRLGFRALRPCYAALATGRFAGLPTLDDALGRYFFATAPAGGGRV